MSEVYTIPAPGAGTPQEVTKTALVGMGQELQDEALSGKTTAALVVKLGPDGKILANWAGLDHLQVIGLAAFLKEVAKKAVTR